jgi:PKHD-type hydroxylase
MDDSYIFPIKYTEPTQYYTFQEAFSSEEIELILELMEDLPFIEGSTKGKTEDGYRSSSIKWVPQEETFKWIYDRIGEMAIEANDECWEFDLHSMPERMQYTEYYEDGGQYNWHLDIGPNELSQRKISITIQLSDPSEYEGGNLELLKGAIPLSCPKGKGTAVLFPSYILHRISPVTKGTRRSLVLWLGGNHLK